MGVKIPFSQYLNGYNSISFRDYRDSSAGLTFVPPELQTGPSRESQMEAEINGHREHIPVYELHSDAFDCWGLMNSRYVWNGRHAGFTQYIALDGMDSGLRLDADDMDALRRSIAQTVDAAAHNLFMNGERYIEVAEGGRELESGDLPVELIREKPAFRMNRETAYLIMRIWQNCWDRMYAIMNGKGVSLAQRIEIYLAKPAEDPVQACVDVFAKWLSGILPPQVMSMISASIGVPFSGDKWEDAAFKILLDGHVASEVDRDGMFCLEAIYDGIPAAVVAPRNWEASMSAEEYALFECIAQGKLPEYFETIERDMREGTYGFDDQRRGRYNVIVRADYDLLLRCAAVMDMLGREDAEFDYDTFRYANNLIGQMVSILQNRYELKADDIHGLLKDAEYALVKRAEKFKGELEEYEYRDLALIYTEVRQNDPSLAERILSILTAQARFADSKARISDDAEMAVIELLWQGLLDAELRLEVRGEALSREEYIRWAGLHEKIASEGKRETLKRLEAALSARLRFEDEGQSPLEVAEEYGLSNVVQGLVRGIIVSDAQHRMGRLPSGDYRQILSFYTDDKYQSALTDEIRRKAEDILCAQYGFGDHPAAAADLLAEKDLTGLWNRSVRAECEDVQARGGVLTRGDFDRWVDRLSYQEIEDDAKTQIIRLLAEKTHREGYREYILSASDKRQSELEEALVKRQLDVIGSVENRLPTEEFTWWLERYEDAVREEKGFAGDLFGMLKEARLKESDADILEIVREAKQWKLLSALAVREAPKVNSLSAERRDKWMAIYTDLQRADSDVDMEAVEECERLLIRRIDYDALEKIFISGDRSKLYWNSLGKMLESERAKDGRMPETIFRAWIRYLKDAENEGEAVGGEIRELLARQYEVRGEADEIRTAYDIACELAPYDEELLTALIRTEYDRTICKSGVKSMPQAERWLKMYSYLINLGNVLAEDVANALCAKWRVDNGYVLDVARQMNVNDLEVKLIRAEFDSLSESNSIANLAALQRWLQHYRVIRQLGEDELADQIAGKICVKPIVGNQYILRTVLEAGCEDLEEAVLTGEKQVGRQYTAEEYEERLNRYFANQYTDIYLELLTGKGSRIENLERFSSYMRIHTLRSECVHGGAVLLEEMAGSLRQVSQATLDNLRYAVEEKETVREILRANQPVLGQIINQALQNGMRMEEMSPFYVLRDASAGSHAGLDERAAREMAEALVEGNGQAQAQTFNGYFKNGVSDGAAECVLTDVKNLLNGRTIGEETLDAAASVLGGVRIPLTVSVKILEAMLRMTAAAVDVNTLFDFVVNQEMPLRTQMMVAVAAWMKNASGQKAGVLDAAMAFTGRLSEEALGDVSGVLFEGVKGFLRGNNDCANMEYKTYERAVQLWAGRADLSDIVEPLLNSCLALTDTMTDYVRGKLMQGPFSVDERYVNLIACRDRVEIGCLTDVLREVASIREFCARTEREQMPWLDEEGFSGVKENEQIAEGFNRLAGNEVAKRVEERRVGGSRTSVLDGLHDVVNDIRGAATLDGIRRKLNACLDVCIEDQVSTAFSECVKLFEKQNADETANALDKLRKLLNRIGADVTRPISVSTVDWCQRYMNAVVRKQADAVVIREIHANRRDFDALRAFVLRVYEQFISREDIDESMVYASLAAAKVLDLNNVWTRYIMLTAHLTQENIWASGQEAQIVMHVVFLYKYLEQIGDDIATANSLADYCAADGNFAAQQKKLKSAELKNILSRSRVGGEKTGGLFGWLKK